MTKAQLETLLRNDFLSAISTFISEDRETDVLPVSASELAIPCLDAEGNEKWVLIKVSIPRGTRNGEGGYDPYDGYFLAKEYQEDLKEKAEKKAKKQSTSSTYSPFSTKDNVNELSTQQGQTFTTQPVSKAGFGFDTDNSSMLLSSIMIVGAALLVCLSGALIYRNKTNKQDK